MQLFNWERLREKGNAMVELSVTLPVFCLLTFGALQFAGAQYEHHALYRAALNAARIIVTNQGDLQNIDNDVKKSIQDSLKPYKFKFPICAEVLTQANDPFAPVTVILQSPIQLMPADLYKDLPKTLFTTANASAFRNHEGLPPKVKGGPGRQSLTFCTSINV